MAKNISKPDEYASVSTPQASSTTDEVVDNSNASVYKVMTVKPMLYTSVMLALLMPVQFGWSVSQLNLSKFNDKDDCKLVPVPEDKCIMFPGHTTGQWSLAVNMWIVGGMIGSLGCGRIADAFGRRRTLMVNALIIVAGSIVQAASGSIGILALGRFISGIGSGVSTAVPNGFINEVSPPHLRNKFGITYQIAVTLGILLVGITFFFADTKSGWRYIAGFPVVLAGLFLIGAPFLMVESPTWLLTKGRQEEAENEIKRLFGEENVKLALSWMSAPESASETEEGRASSDNGTVETDVAAEMNPWKALLTPAYRQQTIIAVMLSFAQQLSGINAVFFYSSDLFKDAGLSDVRIGSVIVDVVNMLPTFFAGALGTKFGNRGMMIYGHGIMLLSAVGVTISLLTSLAWLSIIFLSIYVAAFAVSLGPLVFVIATSIFPNALRASGTSVCLFANWVGTLVVGIGYPYVADALNDWGFTPFVVTLTLFGLFMIKFLPETSGLTNDEIQDIFRNRLKEKEVR